MSNHKITPEEDAQIKELFLQGLSNQQIHQKLHIPFSTVRARKKNYGINNKKESNQTTNTKRFKLETV